MVLNNRLSILIGFFVLLISCLIGKYFYSYFSYSYPPEVFLIGLSKDGWYKDTISGTIKSENGYKVSTVNFLLDGKPFNLISSNKVSATHFEIPFSLDTKELSNGEHTLELNSVDGSYHQNKSKDIIPFHVDNTPLQAAFLDQSYKVEQGKTIHVQINTNKSTTKAQIKLFSKVFECYQESDESTIIESFIPIDCEQEPNEYQMIAEVSDKVGNTSKLINHVTVKAFDFPKQKYLNVSQEKLDEEQEISISSKVLEDALTKWVKDSPKKKLWTGAFELPIEVKKITTPFGEVRTTAQKGRYIHKAIDMYNMPKSVVWAAQNGKVIIRDRYLMSGNTVVLDHGLGVFTMYFHLDSFANINVGDMVKKGNPLGTLGKTGYASGYHLHWELRVNNVAVDPMQWVKKSF